MIFCRIREYDLCIFWIGDIKEDQSFRCTLYVSLVKLQSLKETIAYEARHNITLHALEIEQYYQ